MATKKRAKRRSPRKRVGAVHHTAKKHTAHRRSPRKKVGAINMTTEIILGAVAGAFVTRVIMKNLPAPTDSKATDYRPYTGLAVGAAAEFFGKNNLLVRAMGIGAIVEGSRSIIEDKYIPDFNEKNKKATTAGIPYTVTGNRTRRLMGSPNALAGMAGKNKMGATSTPQSLAGIGMSNHIIYDGM